MSLTAVRLAGLLALGIAGCGQAPIARPAPTTCGTHRCSWGGLVEAVDSAVRAGAAPGAVVAVSVRGARFYHHAGQLGTGEPVPIGPETIYDLASLTKVVALTTLAMMAVDEGLIRLDDPVSHYLPQFQGANKNEVTVRHLLTHSSGLPAHRPLWREATDRDSALQVVLATPLDTVPGARTVYSDLGAITLTQIVERVYGHPIDHLFAERVAKPLGLRATRFLPPESWRPRIAPTERDPWRGRLVRGEVHDENAAFLRGVSGHAGLFSNARDLLSFGEWLLEQRRGRGGRRQEPRITDSVVAQFTRRQDLVAGSSRALGWDTPALGSSAGSRLSAESFGHTGFTGTSIWIDPTRSLVVVLLSNRVNPTRDNPRLGPLRALVADRVVAAIELAPR
jgi:CubicO group peptidase (beta-lactamase class C family)